MNSILADVKPVVWVKWKNRDPQVAPLSRSGHTLTQFGGKIILFGGTVNGIEDPNIKRVGPSNDLWLLEIFQKNITDGKASNREGTSPPREPTTLPPL